MAVSKTNNSDLPHWFTQRAEARLQFLYGADKAPELMDRLIKKINAFAGKDKSRNPELWSEQDSILITYGGSVLQPGERPLKVLFQFLSTHLQNCIKSVHILPYFPYSSDDGFAVIDYKKVDPPLGDWSDIERIARTFDLMTDLVINHVSRNNLWFIDYLNNAEPGCNYFIELPAETDVSTVVRPRSSPLLQPVLTHRGTRHVWATFGEDQIDVNFAVPEVLFEFIDILLLYIGKGSRFIRLDAVAFLWKRLGTRCINLRETHEVVKLLRDIIDVVAPETILITETNVPNGENLSYFGNSDEAHMVYQFCLPPLLLHALHHGNSGYLTAWAKDMPRPQKNCTYLNFIASHDGIGLRPAEGILPEDEVSALVDAMRQYGGYVSMRSDADGKESPYEINIALFDALKGTCLGEDDWQVARFLCAHALMLALQGIPALYIHSLTATRNDYSKVEATGRTRSINRHQWDYQELMTLLNSPTPHARVFNELKHFLSIRRKQSAFHPEAAQETLDWDASLMVFWRISRDASQRLLIAGNITAQPQTLPLPAHPFGSGSGLWRDLIAQKAYADTHQLALLPYQTVWLEALN